MNGDDPSEGKDEIAEEPTSIAVGGSGESQFETLRILARSPRSLANIACAPECQMAYATAFLLLAEDRPAEAAGMLQRTLPEIRDPILLASATTLLDLAEARSEMMALQGPTLLGGGANEGRFALVGWTTMGSLGAGILTGAMLDLPDARSNVLMVMALTGTGLAASLVASREASIAPATASFYGTGLVAGGLTAWQAARIAELSPQVTAGMMLAGGIAGGAIGYWGGKRAFADPASASMLASGLAWGTATGLLLVPVVKPSERFLTHGLPLAGTTLGLATGAFAASRANLSRTRVLLMDLGALVGGLGLGGLGIAILDESPAALFQRVVPAMALAGIVGGGSIALLMTRNLEEERPATPNGHTGTALLERHQGAWTLGTPAPIALTRSGGELSTGLGILLMAGEL